MNKDDKDKRFLFHSTPSGRVGENALYKIFEEFEAIKKKNWIGLDWAKDSGMNRGDVIKRDKNVTHVRFNAVGVAK